MINLCNENCFEYMKLMNKNSVDLILTDPPYGMKFQSHRRKTVYDKIENDDNVDFLDKMFSDFNRILKDNSAIYVFCSWHNVDSFKSKFEKYFKLKNILVWVKNNHGSGDLKAQYAPKYEFILYGNKGRRNFENGRNEDVLFFNKTNNKYHPTEKPVELLEFLIKNSSKENELVFDPFAGSGSTGVACINTNRKFLGVEINNVYFDIAKQRIYEAETSAKQLTL